MNDAERGGVLGNDEGSATGARDVFNVIADLPGQGRTLIFKEARDGIYRPLANADAVQVDAAHARLSGERDELGMDAAHVAAAQVVLLLGEHDDGAALRRFVRKRRQLCGIGEPLRGDVGGRAEFGGLAVA